MAYRKFQNSPNPDLENIMNNNLFSLETVNISMVINGQSINLSGHAIGDMIRILDERIARLEELGLVERFKRGNALK